MSPPAGAGCLAFVNGCRPLLPARSTLAGRRACRSAHVRSRRRARTWFWKGPGRRLRRPRRRWAGGLGRGLRHDVGQRNFEHLVHDAGVAPAGSLPGKLLPMSASFAAGRTPVAIPNRHAASTFSGVPATGSTCPPSVSSPVIATSHRTGRPVNAETMAAATVTPAEAPSFDRTASGRCTYRSVASSKLASTPANRPALVRTYVSATFADSVIFGPTVPVTCIDPAPGEARRLDDHNVAAVGSYAQTQGDAGPGDRPASSASRNRVAPSHRVTVSSVISPGRRRTLRPQTRRPAAERVDAVIKQAHPGFGRVAADQEPRRGRGEGQLHPFKDSAKNPQNTTTRSECRRPGLRQR